MSDALIVSNMQPSESCAVQQMFMSNWENQFKQALFIRHSKQMYASQVACWTNFSLDSASSGNRDALVIVQAGRGHPQGCQGMGPGAVGEGPQVEQRLSHRHPGSRGDPSLACNSFLPMHESNSLAGACLASIVVL